MKKILIIVSSFLVFLLPVTSHGNSLCTMKQKAIHIQNDICEIAEWLSSLDKELQYNYVRQQSLISALEYPNIKGKSFSLKNYLERELSKVEANIHFIKAMYEDFFLCCEFSKILEKKLQLKTISEQKSEQLKN